MYKGRKHKGSILLCYFSFFSLLYITFLPLKLFLNLIYFKITTIIYHLSEELGKCLKAGVNTERNLIWPGISVLLSFFGFCFVFFTLYIYVYVFWSTHRPSLSGRSWHPRKEEVLLRENVFWLVKSLPNYFMSAELWMTIHDGSVL